MSAAERFRRHTLAARFVAALRAGEGLDDVSEADLREIAGAAADYLEAGLAEPAPVAGASAEDRGRLRALAERCERNSAGPWAYVENENDDGIICRSVVDASGGRVAEYLYEEDGLYLAAIEPSVVISLLAALDAAEARAAQAERERDEATQGAEALAKRLTEIRSLYESASGEWRIGGDDAG